MKKHMKLVVVSLICAAVYACSGGETAETPTWPSDEEVANSGLAEEKEADPMDNKGVGPISSVELEELDQALVTTGAEMFESKCSACHKVEKRYIGPMLAGVLERRSPEWIMNMILDPEGMVANDPIAKNLLMEYSSPMANQSLTEEEARSILEFFRTI